MMNKKLNTDLYERNGMDHKIDHDVAELRSLLKDLPEPSEPHPAYWNNFLLRVHEQIEAEAAPKRKAWWSPALIWGSLTGTAAMIAIAVLTGIVPIGGANKGGETIADLVQTEQPAVQPVEQNANPDDIISDEALLEQLAMDRGAATTPLPSNDPVVAAADDNIILTDEDVKMIQAIDNGDDAAILLAMVDDIEI